MKYYLDEDLSPQIAELLRKRGVDSLSAHEIQMMQATDLEQLTFAAEKKRCFVTKNRDDFVQLTVQFFNDHRAHHGVLIIPHSIPGDQVALIAKALADYAEKHPKGLPSYSIDFLSSE